jgi:hypothetical protein
MGIGRRSGVNILGGCVLHHIQKFRIEVGFSLKIVGYVSQLRRELIDDSTVGFLFQHAGVTGKASQSAWTLRTPQIAGCGGFDGNG